MTNDERDDANDSQALTGGDITMYRALVARISDLSQDRPDLKFAAMQVCCAVANPSASDLERVKRIGRYLVENPRAECLFHWQQGGGFEAHSDEVTRRSVSVGVIMRGGHCLKVWTKKQQVVSLSTAESELYAPVKTASEGLGIQSVAKDLGIVCARSTAGTGHGKVRRHAELVDTRSLQVKKIRHEEGTNAKPAGLMTKPWL